MLNSVGVVCVLALIWAFCAGWGLFVSIVRAWLRCGCFGNCLLLWLFWICCVGLFYCSTLVWFDVSGGLYLFCSLGGCFAA